MVTILEVYLYKLVMVFHIKQICESDQGNFRNMGTVEVEILATRKFHTNSSFFLRN